MLFEAEGFSVAVECKRPRNQNRVRACANDAIVQALRLVEAEPDGTAAGLIALDLSQVLNAGNPTLDTEEVMEQAMDDAANTMFNIITRAVRVWPPKILGAISRFSGLAVDRPRQIPVHLQQWIVVRNGSAQPEFIPLRDRIGERLNETSGLTNYIADD